MADDSADALATRLRTAFDLCELGESMRRAQVCREHPDATGEEIEALLVTWLETRPGAEHGDSGSVVDLLFASSGIEPEVVAAADRIEVVPGFTVPVARLGHLIALKVLARDDRTRPQDRVDLAALLTQADAAALGEAREALTLVANGDATCLPGWTPP